MYFDLDSPCLPYGFHQSNALVDTWPVVIREACFAANENLVLANQALALLMEGEPQHALIFVKSFARLERKRRTNWQPIAAVEKYFMEARNNQPFRWGEEDFTCAHRAVLSLTDSIADKTYSAMRPGVCRIVGLSGENVAKEWEACFIRWAQKCGLLDDQEKAGGQWAAFCERGQNEMAGFPWDHKTEKALRNFLILEANQASPFLMNQQRGVRNGQVTENNHSQSGTGNCVTGGDDAAPPPEFLSATDLTHRLNQNRRIKVSKDAVESYLRRLRDKRPDCFERNENSRKNEARYLYRCQDVWTELEAHFREKS